MGQNLFLSSALFFVYLFFCKKKGCLLRSFQTSRTASFFYILFGKFN